MVSSWTSNTMWDMRTLEKTGLSVLVLGVRVFKFPAYVPHIRRGLENACAYAHTHTSTHLHTHTHIRVHTDRGIVTGVRRQQRWTGAEGQQACALSPGEGRELSPTCTRTNTIKRAHTHSPTRTRTRSTTQTEESSQSSGDSKDEQGWMGNRAVRYLRGRGKKGYTSLAQNYRWWWSGIVLFLLLGNAALFIWSNLRYVVHVLFISTSPSVCVCE